MTHSTPRQGPFSRGIMHFSQGIQAGGNGWVVGPMGGEWDLWVDDETWIITAPDNKDNDAHFPIKDQGKIGQRTNNRPRVQ